MMKTLSGDPSICFISLLISVSFLIQAVTFQVFGIRSVFDCILETLERVLGRRCRILLKSCTLVAPGPEWV